MSATGPEPVGTAWARPGTIAEACTLLKSGGPRARVVAGCTALTPGALAADRELRIAVDITAIPGLRQIEERDAHIMVGSTVTARELAASPIVAERVPLLAFVAAGMGDEVIQGMATVGGNVATRNPVPFELPTALAALGASMEVHSSAGVRTVAARDLGNPALVFAADEVISGFSIPTTSGRWLYRRLTTHLTPHVIASLAIQAAPGGPPTSFASLGGPWPQRLAAVEEALADENRADPADVARSACAELRAHDDALASGEYRLRALRVAVESALVAFGDAR